MDRKEMNERYDKLCKLEIDVEGDEVLHCPSIARLPDDLFEAVFKMDMCPAEKQPSAFGMAAVCRNCEWNAGEMESGGYVFGRRCKILNLHEQFKKDGMLLEEEE